ncbi:MAG: hypothetical protein HPY66_3197 [Firmicutes bacterium]|nr:hypothetical protein [Bacillota bacterium]
MNNETNKTFKAAFAALDAMENAKDLQWIMPGFDRAFFELDITGDAETKEKMIAQFSASFNEAVKRIGREAIKKAIQENEALTIAGILQTLND